MLDHGGHRTAGTCPHPRPQAPWLWDAHPAESWGFSSPLDAVSGHRPQLECPEFSAATEHQSFSTRCSPSKGMGPGGRVGVTAQQEFSVCWVSLLGSGRLGSRMPLRPLASE